MKYLIIFSFLLTLSFESISKEKDEITFLVLFNIGELNKIETTTNYIELNFFEKFQTKSYSGNSDAALLITVPNGDMNECQMGEMLVQVNNSTWIPLHEIAFRIIDLNESQQNYEALLTMKESADSKTKNNIVRLKL